MCRDTIESASLAILSFILAQYFGADCADWAMAVLVARFNAHFPKVSAMLGSMRSAAVMSGAAAASSPLRRYASPRP